MKNPVFPGPAAPLWHIFALKPLALDQNSCCLEPTRAIHSGPRLIDLLRNSFRYGYIMGCQGRMCIILKEPCLSAPEAGEFGGEYQWLTILL